MVKANPDTDKTLVFGRLVHDVGKYVSRAARNLPEGKISEGLAELLLEDLFETDGKRDALHLFDRITEPLDWGDLNEEIQACRGLLVEIVGDRGGIERRDDASMRRAAELAVEVDTRLRNLAVSVAKEKR